MSEPCFAEDDYLRELQEDRGQALWVARLADGRAAYRDDGRPGRPGSAWADLAAWLPRSGTGLVGLELKFRSEWLRPLPAGAAGYYFARGLLAFLDGAQTAYFAVGWLDGDVVRVKKVSVPDLVLFEEEARAPVGPCLIRNG